MASDPRDDDRDRSAILGGADAVIKTTYVTGHGTEPESRGRPIGPTRSAGPGIALVVLVGILVALLVAAIYAFGGVR